MPQDVVDVEPLDREEVRAGEVAHALRERDVRRRVDDERLLRAERREDLRSGLGLRPLRLPLLDDHDLLVAAAQRERGAQRRLPDLLRDVVGVVAGLRPHRLAAAHPLRRARRALAGAAGVLLLPRLLAATGDEGAVLHRVGAGAVGGELRLHHFVEEVLVHLAGEDGIGEVELAHLLLFEIVDVELGHGRLDYLISTSTPAERSSFMSASSVCGVGSRMSSSRLWVRISNCSRDFLSTCGLRRTVNLLILVGSGMGPATFAPVRFAVSTISPADWSSSL